MNRLFYHANSLVDFTRIRKKLSWLIFSSLYFKFLECHIDFGGFKGVIPFFQDHYVLKNSQFVIFDNRFKDTLLNLVKRGNLICELFILHDHELVQAPNILQLVDRVHQIEIFEPNNRWKFRLGLVLLWVPRTRTHAFLERSIFYLTFSFIVHLQAL